jgi:hypothetical protein
LYRDMPGPDLLVAAVRPGWALTCAAAPAAAVRRIGLDPADRPAVAVLRFLGVRELVQVGVVAAAPRATRAAAWVDTVHAVSMVGLAAASARYRRAAVVQAAVASVWALAGHRAAGR